MLIYGASGHAKVVVDCLKSMNERILAVFDDDRSKNLFLEFVIINDYTLQVYPEEPLIIAIGDNLARKIVAEEKVRHRFGTARHISAIIEKQVPIGEGTVIFHGTIIQAGSKVGRQVILNTGVSVDHDCIIGDFVHIAPHATLCGNVTLDEGAMVGAGAVVLPGLHIGEWSVIGAGTVVTKDVPPNSVIAGNPGRILKK